MAEQIRKGDIGAQFKVTIRNSSGSVVDISSATTLQMIFRKPSSTVVTKTASFFTDGTDGILSYTTDDATVLNEVGNWELQCRVVIGSSDRRTSIVTFRVYRILE